MIEIILLLILLYFLGGFLAINFLSNKTDLKLNEIIVIFSFGAIWLLIIPFSWLHQKFSKMDKVIIKKQSVKKDEVKVL